METLLVDIQVVIGVFVEIPFIKGKVSPTSVKDDSLFSQMFGANLKRDEWRTNTQHFSGSTGSKHKI